MIDHLMILSSILTNLYTDVHSLANTAGSIKKHNNLAQQISLIVYMLPSLSLILTFRSLTLIDIALEPIPAKEYEALE